MLLEFLMKTVTLRQKIQIKFYRFYIVDLIFMQLGLYVMTKMNGRCLKE